MKATWIVMARNKAQFVGATLDAIFAQKYDGHMEIVVSDQGSTDGTLDVIRAKVKEYRGPFEVHVLQCPDVEYRGMVGMNRHLNWLHEKLDTDVVINCSADDISLPQRAYRVMQAYEAHPDALMVDTRQFFANPGDEFATETTAYDGQDGFVDPHTCIYRSVGGSTTQSWRQSFYERAGPMEDACIMDLYLPLVASVCGGLWCIYEPLHIYYRHASADNAGLDGVMLAAAPDDLRALEEVSTYQLSDTYFKVVDKAFDLGIEDRAGVVFDQAVAQAKSLLRQRTNMMYEGIEPMSLRV